MTLPPFDLHRARSVEEAGELLARYGEDAAVMCGGTELLLAMKHDLLRYEHLVDVKPLPGLNGIEKRNNSLHIGATVTHRAIEKSAVVREIVPVGLPETRTLDIRETADFVALAGYLRRVLENC